MGVWTFFDTIGFSRRYPDQEHLCSGGLSGKTISVHPLCSPCLRGEDANKTAHHRVTENTEDAQRRHAFSDRPPKIEVVSGNNFSACSLSKMSELQSCWEPDVYRHGTYFYD